MMSLDDRQKTVKKVFTREQLEGMDAGDLVKLVGEAGSGAKIHISAVVKGPDGEIKYDPTAIPGDYGETEEELAAHAEATMGA